MSEQRNVSFITTSLTIKLQVVAKKYENVFQLISTTSALQNSIRVAPQCEFPAHLTNIPISFIV